MPLVLIKENKNWPFETTKDEIRLGMKSKCILHEGSIKSSEFILSK